MRREAFLLAFVFFMKQVKGEKSAFDKMPGPFGLHRTASSLETFNTCKMDVRLINVSDPTLQSHGSHGFVDIHLPPMPRPLFVCFPRGTEHLSQMILLSHAICRQMGHMTASALHGVSIGGRWLQSQNTSLPTRGLSPRSWNCSGHEQTIGQCSWRQELSLERCNALMDVGCGECEKVIKGTNGTINTPGYPHTYVYDVTCNWTLEAPWDNTLFLQFQEDPEAANLSFACKSCRPYIDIVNVQSERVEDNSSYYSSQTRATRYHNFGFLRRLRVPYRKIEVHYFSGLHSPRSTVLPRGFQFNFTAIPVKTDAQTDHLTLYTLGGSFLFLALICCICGCLREFSSVKHWMDECREPFVSASESPAKTSTPVNEDLPPSYATVKASDQRSPPAFDDVVSSAGDMDLCLSLDEEINLDGSRQFERCTFGLRLRSPDISQLEERDEFITVVSTPIEPSGSGESNIQRTVLRPPWISDDTEHDFKTHVRTKLCDRYSRNSTTNLHCGVFLGDEQSSTGQQENMPSAQYLQVDSLATSRPSLIREKAVPSSSMETTVFLSAEDRTPAWESQQFNFDLDQEPIKNL